MNFDPNTGQPLNQVDDNSTQNINNTPVAQTPVTPVAQTPVTPVVQTPVTPVAQTPVTPVAQTPVTPVAQTPVTPVAQTPVTPVTQTPVTPVIQQQPQQFVQQPVQQQVNQGFQNVPVNNIVQNVNQQNALPAKKFNKLFIIIPVCVVALIIFIAIIATVVSSLVGGSSSKSTDYDGYTAADIDYTCTYYDEKDGKTINASTDLCFNLDNYQLKSFTKIVRDYNSLSDDEYKEFFEENFSGDNVTDDGDLGITDFGWSTKIKRDGNVVTITYMTLNGYGQGEISSSDEAEVIDGLEDQGFVCKKR